MGWELRNVSEKLEEARNDSPKPPEGTHPSHHTRNEGLCLQTGREVCAVWGTTCVVHPDVNVGNVLQPQGEELGVSLVYRPVRKPGSPRAPEQETRPHQTP